MQTNDMFDNQYEYFIYGIINDEMGLSKLNDILKNGLRIDDVCGIFGFLKFIKVNEIFIKEQGIEWSCRNYINTTYNDFGIIIKIPKYYLHLSAHVLLCKFQNKTI